jgi:hypothetical protein
MSDVGQRIETSAVCVAGEVVERFQLAEHSERGIGSQHPFEFGQVCDFMAA